MDENFHTDRRTVYNIGFATMKNILCILILLMVGCKSQHKPKDGEKLETSDSASHIITENNIGDTLIKSERIEGPANVRDTVNGKLLYVLNDNAIVSANEVQNNWLQVGVFAQLTKPQMDSLLIKKESKIYVDGKEVGKAVQDIHLNGAMTTNDGFFGELVGYTSIRNIKPNTIPEIVLSKILNSKATDITLNDLGGFITNFQLSSSDGLLPDIKGFEVDENWIDDPSPLLRLWLVFKNDELIGIFHSRKLDLIGRNSVHVEREFLFTSFSNNPKMNSDLIRSFNSYIKQVD